MARSRYCDLVLLSRERLPDNVVVRVNPIETDRYNRKVAEVFLGETFINAEMVRKGYAWYYEAYSRNCPNRGLIAVSEKVMLRRLRFKYFVFERVIL